MAAIRVALSSSEQPLAVCGLCQYNMIAECQADAYVDVRQVFWNVDIDDSIALFSSPVNVVL